MSRKYAIFWPKLCNILATLQQHGQAADGQVSAADEGERGPRQEHLPGQAGEIGGRPVPAEEPYRGAQEEPVR